MRSRNALSMLGWPGLMLVLPVLVLSLDGCANQALQDEDGPIEHNPQAARINVQLGAGYLNQGDLKLASLKLERALRQDSDLASAHWTYALLQERLGQPETAEQHFRKAIRLDPKDARAHNNFGTFLCAQGRLEAAQEQFQAALANPLYDVPESALTNAGVCALKANQQDKAQDLFHQALTRNPKYTPALYQLAEHAFIQGQYLQARHYLARYAELAQPTPQSLWLALRAEAKLGNKDAAASYALQLKNRYPASQETAQLRQQEAGGT